MSEQKLTDEERAEAIREAETALAIDDGRRWDATLAASRIARLWNELRMSDADREALVPAREAVSDLRRTWAEALGADDEQVVQLGRTIALLDRLLAQGGGR